MKVVLKKILVSMMLVIVLFNSIFGYNISYAETTGERGAAEEWINSITNAIGGVVSILYWPLRIKIVAISFIISEFVTTAIANADAEAGTNVLFVTPFEIFFNKITMIDVNFFEEASANTATAAFRKAAAKWYYNIRLIAVAAMVVVAVYVGIRMAISTLAEDKAKYKKMLTDFIMSMALLFLMQYIILFVIEFNAAIIRILEALVNQLDGNIDIKNSMWDIAWNALIGIGINSLTSALVYAGIVILTFCFLIAYINRMLKVGFLIMISPLITITYALDKMKDNKSQALDTWLKELIYTILIQPFHCIIYMSYISVCLTLLTDTSSSATGIGALFSSDYNRLANGILAILSLLFIKQAEKIVRKIFGFKDDDEKTSFAAGVAKTAVVMNTIPKAGSAARNLIGKAGPAIATTKLMGKEIGTKLASTKFGQKATSSANNWAKDNVAYQALANKVSQANAALSKASKETKKMITGVKKFTGAPKRFVNKQLGKLDKIAFDPNNSRIKRWAASKTRNAITSVRKGNSAASAIAKIAMMGSLTSSDENTLGNAMAMHSAMNKAVTNFQNGSANQAIDNLATSSTVQGLGNRMDNSASELDQEEKNLEKELSEATATRITAGKNYSEARNTDDPHKDSKKRAYLGAVAREQEIRKALMSKRKHKYDDANSRTGRKTQSGKASKDTVRTKFEKIQSKGSKGEYKKDSKTEKDIKSNIKNSFEGVLASEVANGSLGEEEAKRLSKEFEVKVAGLLGEIELKAGLIDGFDANTVQGLVDDKLKDIFAKIPAFENVAKQEADQIRALIERYRAHRDEAFVYSELSKYTAGGGTIQNLVNQMYDNASYDIED